ncbi:MULTISPECIES: hypothetical protein [Streptomyces]|uniref:hypothetical protein n=1 Tax=Streptomyces TaxID=1883 RepID=UPI0013165310|nr:MULTISPECIES: hypothetical protein [Streptomyces]QGZ50588.1 hypothetical protein GPZ77_21430 [Streptomyces sp. QHH-9511]GGT89860.1 hypothetical protein GCM10010272_38410 [Streptomyces lateritius]
MSLLELIDRADERSLAAAGLACLDRCLPLLAPEAADLLRPVWAAVARGDGVAWGEAIVKARSELAGGEGEAAALVGEMLGAAPAEWAEGPLREWASGCSVTALVLHGRYDAADATEELIARCRAGDAAGAGPLLAGELRRQHTVLESVAHGPTGLRRARELSTEGGRVLRAVVSRRARTA